MTVAARSARRKQVPQPIEYYFDTRAADTAVAFVEKLLVHVKAEWAGQPFILEPWQKKIIRKLFGWKRADGTRKYRRAYIEVARKNGKSTLAAAIALILLFLDEEPGAEVYGAAADREQAAIVFDLAKQMVEASPILSQRAQAFKRSIIAPAISGVYRTVSADVKTKHGFNAHGVIADELHAWPNRDLWDVLTTATGSRRQPLVVAITTAGYDRESICWEEHERARQVLEGVIDVPELFACIFAADQGDDWTDPEIWRKANPGLGVTVKEEYLEAECKRAQLTPAYQNTFRRLHLNQWTQQETRWLPLEAWNECGGAVDPAELEGLECYGGLDLASTVALAAFLLVFPPKQDGPDLYRVLPFFWMPRANLVERGRQDRVSYEAWVRMGLIKATEGNVIDYSQVIKDIAELTGHFAIKEIAFDRWGAFQVQQALEGAGLTMVGFGQGFVSMSPPTKELLRLTLDHKLAHGGNPVLRWMADNVVVRQDPAGNLKPDKQKSRQMIDGIVALIMGLDRALRHGSGQPGSVYEQRGLLGI